MNIISQNNHYKNILKIKLSIDIYLSAYILELSMSVLDGGLTKWSLPYFWQSSLIAVFLRN